MPRRYRIVFSRGVGRPADLIPWMRDLIAVLRRLPPGTSATVTVEHDGEEESDD